MEWPASQALRSLLASGGGPLHRHLHPLHLGGTSNEVSGRDEIY